MSKSGTLLARCLIYAWALLEYVIIIIRVHTGLPKQNSLTFPDFSSQSHNIFPDLYWHKFQYGNCTIRTQLTAQIMH